MPVPLWAWIATVSLICLLVVADFLAHRFTKMAGLRGALTASSLWVLVSVIFGAVLGSIQGATVGGQYFAGYLLEKALSVDNVFAFALLFRSFAIPLPLQRVVLYWGVLGALLLRGGFVAAGGAFVSHVEWALYAFGAVLIVAGVRMARGGPQVDPGRNLVLRGLRRVIPVSSELAGKRFFVREGGRISATPLLVVLIAIEMTDLVFAADSIPAVFGVTRDVFIVFTSNAFAVLGLRSLYFVLAEAMSRFTHLAKGLAALLVLIGLKMLLSSVVHVPVGVTLLGIVAVLGASIGASLVSERGRHREPAGESPGPR